MLIDKIKERITKGNSRSVAVKKNILASLGLKGISVVVSFLLVPATIGYVSSELYGVWLTLSSILTWIQFFDIGLTQGLKNKLTEAIAHDDWNRARSLVSTTYVALTVLFVPISVISYFLVPTVDWASLLNVSPQYSGQIESVMQILVFFVSIQMIVNAIVSVVAAFQKVALSQAFLVIGNIVALVAIVILTRTVPPSLPVLAVVLAGSPIAVTIVASAILFSGRYRRIAPSLRAVRLSHVRSLFSLGIKFFIINFQAVVVFQTTNLLISHVSSPDAVTAYNIAYKYLGIAVMLYSNITLPLWPAYTDAYAKGDFDWMKRMRRKMTKVLALCSAGCLLMALIAQPVYSVWIGDKATVPVEMTWLVALYIIAYCMMNLNGTFLIGMGKVMVESIVVTIGMIVYIPMALGLAGMFHQYGILTALILLNLAYALMFGIQTTKLLDRRATGLWDK